MSVKEIELAITQLPSAELAQLAEWFDDFLAQTWDKQIESDIRTGRLDALIQRAEAELDAALL